MTNRTKIILSLALAVSCGITTRLGAQAPAATPPPLPRFPDGNGAYSVKVTVRPAPAPAAANDGSRSAPPKAPPRKLTGARVTHVDQITHYQIGRTGGAAAELWLDAKLGVIASQEAGSKTVFLSVPSYGPGSLIASLGPANSLFSPVGPGNLAGREVQHGITCLHYKWTVAVLPAPVDYHAWVDEKTGVLVALDDGDCLYMFSFDPTPPAGPLVMPAEFRARLDQYLQNSKPSQHL